jgi:peptidoglycan/xylan/chitin deacetylase (PgdA/CDA1 family)
VFGWQQYVHAQRHIDQSNHNLLPYADFESTRVDHLPEGWNIENPHDAHYNIKPINGYVTGKGLNMAVSQNQTDLMLSSPKVLLKKDTTYFFKSFYIAHIDFDLLMRTYYADGTSRLEFVEHYQPTNDPWSTLSHGFKTDNNITGVQFIYKLLGNGQLSLDDSYLEENPDIFIDQPPKLSTNLIPNPNLDIANNKVPKDWTTYAAGNNQPQFSHIIEGANKYVRVQIANYKDGEAKWQYPAQPVKAGQHFSVELDYKSDTPSELVVESVLENGQHYFEVLDQLHPASEWTHYQAQFETPLAAQTTFVSLVLQHTGTLNTDNYALYDITSSENTQFATTLVSLTFDDGWDSQIKNGVPLLDKFNYKGTFYLNPSTIDTKLFASLKATQILAAQGHEIAAHGEEHLDMTTLAPTALKQQLILSRKFLQKQFNQEYSNFASPYGKADAQMQTIMRAIYRSHRGTKSGINTKQNFDPYDLKVFFVNQQTTSVQIAEAINKAKTFKGWLIFVYHRIEDNGGQNSINTSTFYTQLQLINQSQLPVKTVNEVLDELPSN